MIYIATSGYSYQDWVGPFYPEGTRREKMLEYYARHFPFTEINSTYYHLPAPKAFMRLPERTPEGFRFAVKAHGSMTHERTAGEEAYRGFLLALAPLIETGRLICVLAQFPNSFHHTPQNRDYLRRLAGRLSAVRLAVEFRHDSWVSQDNFAWLRAEGLSYVSVDSPALKGLPGRHAVATGSPAYVRFHGRNAKNWWHHGQSWQRYDYLYSEQELKPWLQPLLDLEQAAGEVYVCFNNHFIGQAVVNARLLAKMLGK